MNAESFIVQKEMKKKIKQRFLHQKKCVFLIFKLNTKNRFGLNLKQDVEKGKKGGCLRARATNKLSKKKGVERGEKKS